MLYSENAEVVGMVSKMAHSSQASSDTMDLVGHLFREPGFLHDYFKQHQASWPHNPRWRFPREGAVVEMPGLRYLFLSPWCVKDFARLLLSVQV